MSVLEIKNISKKFDNKTILDNINISINENRIIGLIGKNGAGKSTLIKIINGILDSDSGEILFNDKPINYKDRDNIAYLTERTYLDKNMKISEALKFMCDFYPSFNKERALKLLKDLNLDVNQRINKLSKGMHEKLRLVLVMSRDADLYILDEPLGGVDPATRDYILDTILSNYKENASVLISTHLIADVEKILDDIIFIDEGKIILYESADKLREKEGCSVDDAFRRMFKC